MQGCRTVGRGHVKKSQIGTTKVPTWSSKGEGIMQTRCQLLWLGGGELLTPLGTFLSLPLKKYYTHRRPEEKGD